MEEKADNVNQTKNRMLCYDSAARYWSQIPATVEGMLGGFGFISRTDIKGSHSFLKHLFMIRDPPGRDRAADCGAGIGRVTKNLLTKFFKNVDLIEQNLTFLEEAKTFVRAKQQTTINYFNVGLQDFLPELETYDVIWSQWVLGHLTDEDLVSFFRACKCGLKPNGVIVVKENITSSDNVEVDYEDSSVTRPLHLFRDLYKQAGLQCIYEQKQTNFPKGIYQVIMFAFRPDQQTNGKVQSIVTDKYDNLSLISKNASSINSSGVNASSNAEEEIKQDKIFSECSETKENELNLNSIDSIVVDTVQEGCNSLSVVNSMLSVEEDVEVKVSPTTPVLKEERILPVVFTDLSPENVKTECQMLSGDDNMYEDGCVEKVEDKDVHCGDIQQDFINIPINTQQESQSVPLEDLQLHCRSLSAEDLLTRIDMQQDCRNFSMQVMSQESCVFETEDMQDDCENHSTNLQQECNALSTKYVQQNCKNLTSENMLQECHMLPTENMKDDCNPTNNLSEDVKWKSELET